ncbi:MAG: hypothetical protein IT262_12590 [Saprospiraceae bacterium]|nr:hypothetical protein [Saprospiraceae bacterium]
MSNYKQQEYDFVNRTKEILFQYKQWSVKVPEGKRYEITLLVNCFIGLLVIPNEEWTKHLPDDLVSEKQWGIKSEHISLIEGGKKQINKIVKHLRNSVSHYEFTTVGNSKGDITRIDFKDFNRQGTQTFEATIPVINLEVFLGKFSEFMLHKMEQQK